MVHKKRPKFEKAIANLEEIFVSNNEDQTISLEEWIEKVDVVEVEKLLKIENPDQMVGETTDQEVNVDDFEDPAEPTSEDDGKEVEEEVDVEGGDFDSGSFDL